MKKLLVSLVAMAMAVSLAGCGSSDTGAKKEAPKADQKFELKLGTNLAKDHVACKGYYKFAEAVEKASKGRIKITVYPGEQLGKESDVTASVNMNAKTCDIVACGPSELSKYDPTFTLFDAPYVFKDGPSMVAFANSDKVQPLYDKLAKASNLRCLGMYYYGAREVSVKGFPAKTPAELAGCKLRVPDSEMAMAYGKALGATPTVMSLGEVYMGIQQGVVAGQENPLPTIFANAYFEVCDNLLMTDHVIAGVTYTIDNKVWESMPKDLQDILTKCVKDSCNAITKDVQTQEKELQGTLKTKGMNIIQVDKAAFQANAKPIYEKYASKWGDWFKTAQSFNK